MSTTDADAAEIARALSLLMQPGDVHELRALETPKATQSGYFTDRSKMAACAAILSGRGQVYVSLNPTIPELIARASNRLKPYCKTATGDSEIMARRWFPIDCDPKRPRDIPSTDAEHAAALDRTREVRGWLHSLGWPEPIGADSGNGGHLLYRVDLPNDEASRDLLSRCLQLLDLRFGDDQVSIDQKTLNAARVWRLYGTMNCKGDGTAERPRRIARILQSADQIALVSTEQLQAMAARLPEPPKKKPGWASLDVGEWLSKHSIVVKREAVWQGGHKWILDVCPFNDDHTDLAAYVLQFPNGAVAAGCHHNSCSGKGWRDLRARFEPEAQAQSGRTSTDGQRPGGAGAEEPIDEGADDSDVRETDLGNARRLVRRHGRDLHYCHPWHAWLVWDGARWARDDTAAVWRMAKETIQDMYIEAAADDDSAARKDLVRHALRSEAEARIKAMIALAESEPGIPVLPDQLDTNPMLLNVANGTIDLRTGKLREHRREDLITRLAPVVSDLSAECPIWLAFLDRIMDGNVRVIRFLQRAIGYSLTGLTVEEIMLILWGLHDNGKTTLIELLLVLLGDYACSTPPETFLLHRTGAIPNDIARLKGMRFVSAVETDEGKIVSSALIKRLTGRDTISARFMRAEWFDFKPEFTPWLATNYKPTVPGRDTAIWDRLRLVPFTVTIPVAEQDKDLPLKLLGELPGILAWAVRGCVDWQRDGLAVPPEVMAATETYRVESDAFARFLDECCVIDPNAKATSAALYAAYKSWAESNGESPLTSKKIGELLRDDPESRFRPDRTNAVRSWLGIGLLSQPGFGDDAFDARDA